jgi:predicted RNase H-like HicB family nuclease
MKYLIVIEETRTGFSAFYPDIDRCVATGATKEKVENNMLKHLSFIWKD